MPEAVTVDRSHIFIIKDTTLSPHNIAGYEIFHLWKSGTGRDAYIETPDYNLLFSSKAFQKYQSPIAEAYLGGEADLANDAQIDKLREELFACISGDIHERTNEALLRPMFRDFDAVRAAWEQLVEENRGEARTLVRKLTGAKRAETLRERQGDGTIKSRNSWKENGENGRKETDDSRIDSGGRKNGRQASDRGGAAKDGGVRGGLSSSAGGYGGVDPSFGEQPVRSWAAGHIVVPPEGSVAQGEQRAVMEYGVPSFVVEYAVWQQNRGRNSAPAFSAGGQIYFRESLPHANRGMFAPHELTHVMRQVGYQPCRFVKHIGRQTRWEKARGVVS